MGKLIDAGLLAERLQDFVDWCRDERKQGVAFVLDCPLPNSAPVEAIPKAEYEARLKADLEVILKEMSKTIEEEREDCEKLSNSYERFGIKAMAQRSQIVIKQKIDALKGAEDDDR